MKSTLLTIGTILVMLPQAFIFAEESHGNQPPPPPKSNETKNTDAKYWEEQKIHMQNKSTEMRKAKYAELVVKWIDVSALTPELLDATKTEESKFWDALRTIQQAGEIRSRKEYLTKLASQGIDTTVFTDAIIADGNLFWELAKKVQIQHPVVADRPSVTPRVETGSTASNQARELETRQKIIEELKAHGIDTSGFTTNVISNSEAFWKLVQSLKSTYEKDHQEKTPIKNYEWTHKNNESKYPIKKDEKGVKNDTPREQSVNKNNHWVLSTKARNLFQARLDNIPAEKKESMLTKLEEVLKKQIETARSKSNKRLTEKLEIMLTMVEEEISSLEDTSLVDGLLANN